MATIYLSCINSMVKVYIFTGKYKHVLNYYISVCTDAIILYTCFILSCTFYFNLFSTSKIRSDIIYHCHKFTCHGHYHCHTIMYHMEYHRRFWKRITLL